MNKKLTGTRPPRKYSFEMNEWIRQNATVMVYRNQKHFVDLFNAIWGTDTTLCQMNEHLYRMGVSVLTAKTVDHYSDEKRQWLINNYSKFDCDFKALAQEFNTVFGDNKSNSCLAKYCERTLKIHAPKPKKGKVNKGTFVKGHTRTAQKQCPLGTIRMYHSGTSDLPYIKVKMSEGDSGALFETNNGHNMKRPWWIPLKEKVWIDTYGEIPEGYTVVVLDGNQQNCSIENLTLADKRGLAIMGSHKWWSENSKLTGTAIKWCNLYMIAKDNGVYETNKILQ